MKKLTRKALCSLLVVLMCLTSVSIGGFSAAAIKVNGDTTYITQADLEDGYIELGSYPQTQVTDEAIIAALQGISPDTSSWTDYGYYIGDGNYGSMEKSDYMRYWDVTYEGVKYRGVYFSAYRPYRSCYKSLAVNSYQDDNGYTRNKIYWFKFEPLKWRVLDKEKGLIMCESLIDAQPFNNNVYVDENNSYYVNAAKTLYLNEYEMSYIREWLNVSFYNTAFSTLEKTAVGTTCFAYKERYLYDNVSLLGSADAQNSKYGFNSKASRQVKGTDYAKCQGLMVASVDSGNSKWLLFDAHDTGSATGLNIYEVLASGTVDWFPAYVTTYGIRPILTLKLHTHDYTYKEMVTRKATHTSVGEKIGQCVCGANKKVRIPKLAGHTYEVTASTPATCTEPATTTHTCACGDTYTEKVGDALGHSFSGSKCTACGYDRADDCSCSCHKSGLSKFFFSIMLFFQKLFGNNKVCDCGKSHY